MSAFKTNLSNISHWQFFQTQQGLFSTEFKSAMQESSTHGPIAQRRESVIGAERVGVRKEGDTI